MAVITIGRVLNKGSDSVSVVRDPTDATALVSKGSDTVGVVRDPTDSTALLNKTVDTVLVTRDTDDTSRWATGDWYKLVPAQFDTIILTYVGLTENVQTAEYRQGGPTGTIVATLTMGYDGSDRLTSVQRS